MLPRPYSRTPRGRSGQVLLIAVLLMMAILLVGILFVAVVSYNQTHTARDVDVTAAVALARAGINYVDRQLQFSPQGADWRPPFRAYNAATYDANDPDTWPIPPVAVENVGTGAVTYTAGFFGPDEVPYTEDDYYNEQEIARGYYGLVRVNNPGGVPDYYARYGFTRLPAPSNAGGNATPAEQFGHNLSVGRGHTLIRVSYDPDPPYEYSKPQWDQTSPRPDNMSRYLRIEAVGVLDEGPTVVRKLTAYKPIGLIDHILWVTDRQNTGRGTKLGFGPWADMLRDGITWDPGALPADQPDFLTLTLRGSVRVNGVLNITGGHCGDAPASGLRDPAQASTLIQLRTEPLPVIGPSSYYPRGGGYLGGERVIASDGIVEAETVTSASGDLIQMQGAAIDRLRARGNTVVSLGPDTIWPSFDNPATTRTEEFSTYGGAILDGERSMDAEGNSRYAAPLGAPDIFAADPGTGLDRYRQLTLNSGRVVYSPVTGQAQNTGRFGAGYGIYIDNYGDVQFVNRDGSHNIDLLIEDWLQHIGLDSPRASQSSWNATRTLYSPPGVLIELFPTEAAAIGYADPATTIVSTLNPNDPAVPSSRVGPNQVWWPGHVPGEPGIRITRLDRRWRIGDHQTPDRVGAVSGLNVMYRDYPRTGHQVIFAEGNVRVKGVLPANSRTASGALDRDYNLTIVSGATIYIDGQILSPQDVEGRRWGTGDTRPGVLDEDTPHLALLAQDCVAVNTSQIVPQLTAGTVTAAADDPANPTAAERHWELTPGAPGGVYTSWMFGAPPRGALMLLPYHTGQDPGPTGVGMTVQRYNRATNALVSTPFDFDQTLRRGAYTFIFAQPGTLVGGGFLAPQPWASIALSPLYDRGAYPYGASPELPWRLEVSSADPVYPEVRYLSETVGGTPRIFVGQPYGLELRFRDPGLGVAASDYWLRKFKLMAYDSGTDMSLPAINAKINAVMYAQDGCFFVIPGDYFDTRWYGAPAKHYMRYNYGLEIRGAIAENYHARPEAWREWQDKWAIANSPDNTVYGWDTIRYVFDETLLAPRDQGLTNVVNGNVRRTDLNTPQPIADIRGNLPKVPLLPVGRDLIYVE